MGATVAAVMDRIGNEVNTAIDKEEMLTLESFALNKDDHYYKLPPAGSALTRVTEMAVERALY